MDPWGVYRLQLVLGGAGLTGVAFVLAAGVSTVHVAPSAAHHFDVAGLDFTYPAVNAAAAFLLLFAALGAAVLIVTARAAWRQIRAHRRLLDTLPVAGTLPDRPSVSLIRVAEPMAFCAGWLRPRVYVSTAAVDQLSRDELDAVLAHEYHHRQSRDPLRLAVGRVLCQALFFLPVLRPLHDRYGEVAELNADAAAVAVAGVGPLASAMLTFGAAGSDDVVGISPDRVDSLLGRPPAWRLPWALLIVALTTLAAVLALAWRASASASAQATLNLPVASSQPCVLVLALVPIVVCLAALVVRGPSLVSARR
jgi:uncharacterized membrane protein YidH (DUF202 family)